jgi:hypothetical protein
MFSNRYTASALFLFLFVISFNQKIQAKSLYVISDTSATPSRLRAYDIDGTSLVYQTGYNCVTGTSAVGLAIDESEYGDFLFVTFENYNTIEIVDANIMQDVNTVTAGASNLPGIVVDKGKRKVYVMQRYSNHLYSYSWDPSGKKLTPDFNDPYYRTLLGMGNQSPYGAFGIALDEENGRLFVADNTNKIKYYNTNTWSKVGEVNIDCNALGVAIDVRRQLLYYGSMADYSGQGAPNLYQYNLLSGTQQSVNVGCTVAGIAVDQQSSLVYLTTYGGSGYYDYPNPPNDRLMIYDADLVKQPWESGDIGNPAGVAVPQVGYGGGGSLFSISKTDNVPEGNAVVPGDTITYTINYRYLREPNIGEINDVNIIDYLPDDVGFVSADSNGAYDPGSHTVRWNIGPLEPNQSGFVTLTVKVFRRVA